MVRTNLASRPFLDVRAIRGLLVVGALLVGGLTIYNAMSVMRLLEQSQLGAVSTEAEREADRLRVEAATERTRIDPIEMEKVARAVGEANAIIDQRAFSWTRLFSQLEATLPPDLRIRAIQPRLDNGVFRVVISAQARRIEDIENFIEKLERTGAFSAVSPLEESGGDDNVINAVIEGVYRDVAAEVER